MISLTDRIRLTEWLSGKLLDASVALHNHAIDLREKRGNAEDQCLLGMFKWVDDIFDERRNT